MSASWKATPRWGPKDSSILPRAWPLAVIACIGLGHKLGGDRAVCTTWMYDAQFHNDFTSGRCELLR